MCYLPDNTPPRSVYGTCVTYAADLHVPLRMDRLPAAAVCVSGQGLP